MTHPESRCVSPQILTPDTDHHTQDPALRTTHAGYSEDSDHHADPYHPPAVSLLTTLLHSSDLRNANKAKPTPSVGFASNASSTPSTAFSSPKGHSHGILQQAKGPDNKPSEQQPSTSILRRGSVSDGGDHAVGLGLGGMNSSELRLEKVEEKGVKIGWTDVQPAPTRPSALKFAVASQPEGEIDSHGVQPPHAKDEDEDDDSDDGYREDEEDGFGSDDSTSSDEIDPRFPFARPTNFNNKTRTIGSTVIPSASVHPPAPALLPPPARRGRGHIRVDETATLSPDQDKSCSRHRSPPPTRSRSTSHSHSLPGQDDEHHMTGRLSDAGPRNGRAGSPMPRKPSLDTDDEGDSMTQGQSEDEEEDEPDRQPVAEQGGWRSDDAVFYGPTAQQVMPIGFNRRRRHSSAFSVHAAVFVNSEDDDENLVGKGVDGVREFIRRASEHIPGLRRPSSSRDQVNSGANAIRSNTPCPPALDNTPAMAQNLFTSDIDDPSGGLAHRLETALSSPISDASASKSTRRREEHGEISQALPVPHQGVAIPLAVPQGKEEDLGWSEDALLRIRKSRGHDI
ncbi:hypothetical protein CI109_100360 [Kwoniella shandongensis]|uniref:Uncharacterized protein n=1 Tax=Kwoniella shandongensis TaxID=1734106 RepID=A0A5M6C443_9TREE|nr:uncharacterized protein CI109_001794 [Kwoniella shandongensis]KAA5529854.1 hypothetical protein CI109_001794 [Kwoniella shandongensis]